MRQKKVPRGIFGEVDNSKDQYETHLEERHSDTACFVDASLSHAVAVRAVVGFARINKGRT